MRTAAGFEPFGHEHARTACGPHEDSQNAFVAAALDWIPGYDSFAPIDMDAQRPRLMIAGSEGDTRC